MAEKVLFAVGSVLRGDDAAGPLLAKMMADARVEGWEVVDGGQTPEDELRVVRRLRPKLVVVVDAAEMGLKPGSVRRLTACDVATDYLITTHALPLSFLLDQVHEAADEVVFLGVQPADTSFFNPLTPAVRAAVDELFARLAGKGDLEAYPVLHEEEQPEREDRSR